MFEEGIQRLTLTVQRGTPCNNRLSHFLCSGSVRLSSQGSIHRIVGDSRQAKAETPELMHS